MLNKSTAKKILNLITKSNSILLVLHLSPDGDSVGSVLAMGLFLKDLGKKVKIICASKIPSCFAYLPEINEVEIADFAKTNFGNFDLFLALDIAQPSMITRGEFPSQFPVNFKIINIDHHAARTEFGDINLVDSKASSVCEILVNLFKHWETAITKDMAKALFLGIFTDTGCFQYPNCSVQTMRIAAELQEMGAELDETVLTQFRSYSFKNLKYWARVLDNVKIDNSKKFIWATVSRKEIEELEIDPEDMEGAASLFCPVIVGTEFGIILDEGKDFVKGSLRSRAGFDVSSIAQKLGGGGHKLAAGFVLKNCSLAGAEEKVLETARRCLNGGV